MAFDDVARHMAARDRKQLRGARSADQILAEGLVVQARMNRTRDLILGALLLFGGALILTLFGAYIYGVANPSPTEPPQSDQRWAWDIGFVFAAGMVIAGARQLYRGVRNRSPV